MHHRATRTGQRTLLSLTLGLLAAAPWLTSTAGAQADPSKGKQIAATVCAGCHNPDGNSVVPGNPKLAGQSPEYLVKQLTDLAKPPEDKSARENPVMGGFAAMLSPADREDVAAWFSSQKTSAGIRGEPKAAADGARLYRTGLAEKAVPACAGCHGPEGHGLPARFPRIGGQHSEYLENQLRAFREGSRHNNEVMYQIAFRLSDPEIKALATYIAGLGAQ